MSLDDLLSEIEIDSNIIIAGNLSDEELIHEAKRRLGGFAGYGQ